jgi:hypothetical protein
MTLSQRSQIRRCGQRWPTEDAALCSKRAIGGAFLPVPCAYNCGGWHLIAVADLRAAVGQAARRASDTGPDSATRAIVYARDGYACVCCGRTVIGQVRSIGHRKRRSQGLDNRACNLLTFLGTGSTSCHGRIDSRVDPDDEAHGYTLRSRQDPLLVGVMYFERDGSGVTRWLEADGGVLLAAPVGAS